MKIRPCIDIHNGRVKQIVGGTIRDEKERAGGLRRPNEVTENFVSASGADYYASVYREKNLPGGHIILLNSAEKDPLYYEADRQQALAALRVYPGGMQIGGGMHPENAGAYLEAGASHVIVTSYVFRNGRLDGTRLHEMQAAVGKEHLVLDLSCRKNEHGDYVVVTDRWQKPTELVIGPEVLEDLSEECDEFLIHAADVEGRRAGIEEPLARILGDWLTKRTRDGRPAFPVTYAGGIRSLSDIDLLKELSGGQLDATVGSALDLFGGTLELDALVKRADQPQ